jgi:hypothetical protein
LVPIKPAKNFHDETVHSLNSTRIEADEIWSFVYAKEKNIPEEMKGRGTGDVWTAIDADSKMIVSWFVGDRDAQSAYKFMRDVKSRLNKKQY